MLQSTTYRNFYVDAPGYKILDNGAAEGALVSRPQALLDLAQMIGAQEIVVPDVMGNAGETIRLAQQFSHAAQDFPNFNYMGVVQGESMAEVMKCLNGLIYTDYIKVIGIPRILANTIDMTFRLDFYKMVQRFFPGTPCHFLGASNWVKEAVMLAETGARGMDTSLPVVMGLACKDIYDDPYVNRQENYFDLDGDATQRKWIDHNVDTYLGWCRAKASGGEV